MRNDIEAVKLILTYPNQQKEVCFSNMDTIRALTENATKTTTVITGMPGGGGSGRDVLMAKLIDAKDRWYKSMDKLGVITAKVERFILSAGLTPIQERLLFLRYIGGESWAEIANELHLQMIESPSERTIYREHTAALEKCAEYLTTIDNWEDI